MPTVTRSVVALATACALLFGLGGCIRTSDPLPSTSLTTSDDPNRPFTVLTAQRATTTDPAGLRNDTDAMVALDLYQRLLMYQPSTGTLRPDLAKECLYTAETVYECTLPKELIFTSGHALTSSDVKFSLQRALRLANGRLSLLSALDTIETPDPWTVRFRLKYPDNQFGVGLAVPGASIVDEEAYDADQIRPMTQAAVGSGPYSLEGLNNQGITLAKYAGYTGPLGTDMPRLRIQWSDSADAEQALIDQKAEIVWRTLSPAAIDRVEGRIKEALDAQRPLPFWRLPLNRTVLQRLVWLPNSPQRTNATLRRAVALALQEDRTATSILPSIIEGHTDSFAIGGDPALPAIGKDTVLTLSYTNTAPGMDDLARHVRDRLTERLGIEVRLVTEGEAADLDLRDSSPQANTSLGWLQDYLNAPLPGSADKLDDLEERIRSSSRPEVQLPALSELQKQAAVDATVVPIAEVDGVLYLRGRADLVGEALGPGWQLALWGARWRT